MYRLWGVTCYQSVTGTIKGMKLFGRINVHMMKLEPKALE